MNEASWICYKVMKILAVGAGIFFVALMYLESQNVVNINWEASKCFTKRCIVTYKCSGATPLTSATATTSSSTIHFQ